MDFIEPLSLQTWMIQIFAGTPEIFAAIALLIITTLASMFRMTTIGLFFIIAMFLIMFSGFIDSVLLMLIMIIGGLILGYWFYKIFTT
jgi:predicted RND superfamily exporter protein